MASKRSTGSSGELQNSQNLLSPNMMTSSSPTFQMPSNSCVGRIRSLTASDVNQVLNNSHESSSSGPHSTSGLLRSSTLATGSSSSSSGTSHLWNLDLGDLTYLTHMQRVRAKASFARQMSNCSTASERSRRRESFAALNFPCQIANSGSGLNLLQTGMFFTSTSTSFSFFHPKHFFPFSGYAHKHF